MALMIILLIIVLMYHLGQKGKAYREEQRLIKYENRAIINKLRRELEANVLPQEEAEQYFKDQKEANYRNDLRKQGYSDDLIAIILPTIMSDN